MLEDRVASCGKREAGISCDPATPPPDIYFQEFILIKRFLYVYNEMCKNDDSSL